MTTRVSSFRLIGRRAELTELEAEFPGFAESSVLAAKAP
jgi:hypothetical protein